MKRTILTALAAAMAATATAIPAAAQNQNRPQLHVNPRWEECSFQLDASLTQAAWRQFTQEAGLVVYFRPLTDARPMGKGKFEFSILQWKTGIDDGDAAWNDTFVHPDSTHWLFEGSGLKFPGLAARVGVTGKTDVGVYLTKNPNANYGVFGAMVQRALVGDQESEWGLAGRLSFVSLYGPEDLDFAVIGWDLVASREFALARWASVSPYAGISSYFARSHEKTAAVTLDDEYVGGSQKMVGAVLQLSGVRLAMEYNDAQVNSVSMRIGIGR